jgi:hypothetical protein
MLLPKPWHINVLMHPESCGVSKKITFVRDVPKNANGKIDKKRLLLLFLNEVRYEPIII